MWLALHFDWTQLMTSGSKKQSGIEVAVGGEVMMGKGSVQDPECAEFLRPERTWYVQGNEKNQSLTGHIKDFEFCPKINRK